jgi:DNA polymerase-3 subunit epsilon
MSLPLDEQTFCVIDTETTGGMAEHHQVIDVAVFLWRGGRLVRKFESLINPGRPIPGWITALTGINDDMVRHAPSFADIAEPLHEILSEGVFTAHNANFDYSFIQSEFSRVGVEFARPKLCTVRLARVLYPELPSKSLGNLCEHLLIDIWDRHRAAGDAEATMYALKEMIRRAGADHGVTEWEDLHGLVTHGAMRLPHGLRYSSLQNLPEGPGSFVMKDAAGKTVLKGKSTNVRRWVKNLFKVSNQTERANKMRAAVRSIEVKGVPALTAVEALPLELR